MHATIPTRNVKTRRGAFLYLQFCNHLVCWQFISYFIIVAGIR